MAPRRTNNTSEDQAIKAACRKLVSAVGGVEAAEAWCRVGKSKLSEYGRAETDAFMPIDVVKDLERTAHGTPGYPQVTRFLALQAGFALVELPTGEPGSGSVAEQLAVAVSESNDVIAGTLKALADGHVSPAEARRLMPECIEAAEAFMRFLALLEQIAGES